MEEIPTNFKEISLMTNDQNKEMINNVMNLMLQRLEIPEDAGKATLQQTLQMEFIKELNQFMGFGLLFCGSLEKLFEIIRAYIDMLELAMKEYKQ